MAALYLLGGFVVLVCRIRYLPEAVGMIFRYAFVPNAIIGGSLGYALKMAVSQGVKRGLFSNEAGMGSTPHAPQAMAKVKHPHEQGVVAMTGVFIDTFVVLTMTALVVISTLYAGNGILSAGAAEGVSKANMAQLAFGTVLGSRAGSMFVAVCLLFFCLFHPSSAGISSGGSTYRGCWGRRPWGCIRCWPSGSSFWARACPTTWYGSWRIYSTS